jgi:hypothetical protein
VWGDLELNPYVRDEALFGYEVNTSIFDEDGVPVPIPQYVRRPLVSIAGNPRDPCGQAIADLVTDG